MVAARFAARQLLPGNERLQTFLFLAPIALVPFLLDEVYRLRFGRPWLRGTGLVMLVAGSVALPAALALGSGLLPLDRLSASTDRGESAPLTDVPTCSARISRDLAEIGPLYPGRSSIPIKGPDQFHRDVNQVLDELERYSLPRYHQALQYLPKAIFDPDEVERSHPGAAAVSDGYFAVDSRRYGYAEFRRIFLHEVGHNVRGHTRKWSLYRSLDKEEIEAQADEYAEIVIDEMKRCGLQTRNWR